MSTALLLPPAAEARPVHHWWCASTAAGLTSGARTVLLAYGWATSPHQAVSWLQDQALRLARHLDLGVRPRVPWLANAPLTRSQPSGLAAADQLARWTQLPHAHDEAVRYLAGGVRCQITVTDADAVYHLTAVPIPASRGMPA